MSSIRKKYFKDQTRQDKKAKWLLNQEKLETPCCNFQDLLKSAAKYGKTRTARRVDVNIRRQYHRPGALHAAVKNNNLSQAMSLVKRGADVNVRTSMVLARSFSFEGPLFRAASNRNKAMMQFLLDEGADPNARSSRGIGQKPLFALFSYSNSKDEAVNDECIELLLQYGGKIEYLGDTCHLISSRGMMNERGNRVKFLLAHAAMYGSVDEGTVSSSFKRLLLMDAGAIRDYYELCRKVLMVVVFKKLSLLDLLKTSESGMKVLVRKGTFVPAIEKFCCDQELGKLYRYYYINLIKCVSEATDALKFEDEAIVVISKLFNGNHNLCYTFAKKVVGYLGKRDVERLCDVYE